MAKINIVKYSLLIIIVNVRQSIDCDTIMAAVAISLISSTVCGN